MKRTVAYIDGTGVANAEVIKKESAFFELPDGYHPDPKTGYFEPDKKGAQARALTIFWQGRIMPEGQDDTHELISDYLLNAETTKITKGKPTVNKLGFRRLINAIVLFGRCFLFLLFAIFMGLGLWIASALLSPLIAAAIVGGVVAGYWYRLRRSVNKAEIIVLDLKEKTHTYAESFVSEIPANAIKLKGQHLWREYHPLMPWSIVTELYHDKFKPLFISINRDGAAVDSPKAAEYHKENPKFVKDYTRSPHLANYRRKNSFKSGSNTTILLLIIGFLVIMVMFLFLRGGN